MGRYGNAVRAAVLLTVLLQWASGRVSPALTATGQRKLTGAQENCDLCADNWLIILAAGRGTASTTARNMFNNIPGFEISGEHSGILRAEAHILEMANKAQNMVGVAWDNHLFDYHALLCNVQQFAKIGIFGKEYNALSHNATVLGFKEIHYTNFHILRFIGHAFPCARFVFTDWHEDIHPDGAPVSYMLHRAATLFQSTASLLPRDSISVGKYNIVLSGLGVQGCSFRRLLHSSMAGSRSTSNASTLLEGTCDLSQVDFRLDETQLASNMELW
eukprot:CAMPEP_0117667734 /NCGR_PEP_ID=MMETSP0804-20121206/11142_1 /TAXON_ID=1074897 /ORGANISM="Tetraselmis astigmatica, Strain CCMP880" /LENGTH=273 /DNA_ID=CAMNT_0005475515 /DNA_START=289 /DNA_END=1107 /DNA_ORIENTATION=-